MEPPKGSLMMSLETKEEKKKRLKEEAEELKWCPTCGGEWDE